jgi:hypothetical protein
MKDWIYRPEFTTADDGSIVRGPPPALVHKSGAVVDLARSSNVQADMLDAEGNHEEAAELRAIAAGDVGALTAYIQRRQAEP